MPTLPKSVDRPAIEASRLLSSGDDDFVHPELTETVTGQALTAVALEMLAGEQERTNELQSVAALAGPSRWRARLVRGLAPSGPHSGACCQENHDPSISDTIVMASSSSTCASSEEKVVNDGTCLDEKGLLGMLSSRLRNFECCRLEITSLPVPEHSTALKPDPKMPRVDRSNVPGVCGDLGRVYRPPHEKSSTWRSQCRGPDTLDTLPEIGSGILHLSVLPPQDDTLLRADSSNRWLEDDQDHFDAVSASKMERVMLERRLGNSHLCMRGDAPVIMAPLTEVLITELRQQQQSVPRVNRSGGFGGGGGGIDRYQEQHQQQQQQLEEPQRCAALSHQ